ncbi:hypothetical protein MPTK1_3g11520 [Marchantia polymorpha subsp. ruderalis]|uniref:Uncharacterized protein n=2 Tax=Marchantia polymorpha TaxID=3197 RepID=A0AAF6AZQ7_MARPO|nr:hypothetical protein MARPO_0037s0045 [Marchantia polymorpha]BBN05241.1 hypothetical protein Mp_3g11520 [Marchantia polymorpha subsp. ruderalis]|eukprot:PTQ40864.1 hypothetical protein MARPO_0037s0045 [Marchantia polymorpha]
MNDTVEGLMNELQRRNELNVSSASTSPSSPRAIGIGSQLEQQLRGLVSSLSTTSNPGPGPMASPAHSSDSAAQAAPIPNLPPAQRVGRNGAGVAAQAPKKRRTRPSKRPKTEKYEASVCTFMTTVQTLTGGTFCSQANITASPIVSSALSVGGDRGKGLAEVCAPTSMPYAGPSVPAPEACVVRPQPSRPSGHCPAEDSPTAKAEASAGPRAGGGHDSLPPSLFESMFSMSSSSNSLMNSMMGITDQALWTESPFLYTESVGVSSSTSQFSGGHPSDKTFLKERGHFGQASGQEGPEIAANEDPYEVDQWLL